MRNRGYNDSSVTRRPFCGRVDAAVTLRLGQNNVAAVITTPAISELPFRPRPTVGPKGLLTFGSTSRVEL